jgi:hypothetical protein
MKRIEVNVVAFQEGDLWVAQCVEYDIAAFTKNMLELPSAFERAVAANICANADLGREGLDGIPAAPDRYRGLLERAKMFLKPDKLALAPRSRVKIRDFGFSEAA